MKTENLLLDIGILEKWQTEIEEIYYLLESLLTFRWVQQNNKDYIDAWHWLEENKSSKCARAAEIGDITMQAAAVLARHGGEITPIYELKHFFNAVYNEIKKRHKTPSMTVSEIRDKFEQAHLICQGMIHRLAEQVKANDQALTTTPSSIHNPGRQQIVLNDSEQLMANYITQNPGCNSTQVGLKLNFTPEYVRDVFKRKLKKLNFISGDELSPKVKGYYPPAGL